MQLTEAYAPNHLAIKGVTDHGTQCTRQIRLLSRMNEAMELYMIGITVIKMIVTEKGTYGPQTPSPT